MSDIVTYEDVVTFKGRSDVFLIDVRKPNELQDTGSIPSSINIPIAELASTLTESKPEDFKKKYGRDLPSKDTMLVFNCGSGGRATRAKDEAKGLGFVNAKVYKGGWKEWNSRQ